MTPYKLPWYYSVNGSLQIWAHMYVPCERAPSKLSENVEIGLSEFYLNIQPMELTLALEQWNIRLLELA